MARRKKLTRFDKIVQNAIHEGADAESNRSILSFIKKSLGGDAIPIDAEVKLDELRDAGLLVPREKNQRRSERQRSSWSYRGR